MTSLSFRDLTDSERELLLAAESALDKSYSPYSGFSVGAALRTQSGDIITGANMENAAYGLSICAERSAIARANAKGIRTFSALAVIARSKRGNTPKATFPCGACRQVIHEFATLQKKDFPVITSTTDKQTILKTSAFSLLPHAFGPDDITDDSNKD